MTSPLPDAALSHHVAIVGKTGAGKIYAAQGIVELLIARRERACLAAAAQHRDGVTRQQLTILTGYKRSTRDAYIQRLRSRALVATTPEGVRAAGTLFEGEGG